MAHKCTLNANHLKSLKTKAGICIQTLDSDGEISDSHEQTRLNDFVNTTVATLSGNGETPSQKLRISRRTLEGKGDPPGPICKF